MATIFGCAHTSALQSEVCVRAENDVGGQQLVLLEQKGDRGPVLVFREAARVVEGHRPADVVVQPVRVSVTGDTAAAADQHRAGPPFALLAVALRALGRVDVLPRGDLFGLGLVARAVVLAAASGGSGEQGEQPTDGREAIAPGSGGSSGSSHGY